MQEMIFFAFVFFCWLAGLDPALLKMEIAGSAQSHVLPAIVN